MIYKFLIYFIFIFFCTQVLSYPLVDENNKTIKEVKVDNYFKIMENIKWENCKIETNPEKLLLVAKNTLDYIKNVNDDKVKTSILTELGIKQNHIIITLEFIINTIEEDLKNNKKQRILEPEFLEKNFRIIKWYGDLDSAKSNKVNLPEGRIRMTKYVVFRVNGSYEKTSNYNCALYSHPIDENGISVEQALKIKDKLLRFKYTKQDVLSGVYEKNGKSENMAKPLIWLTREGMEQALLEGTIIVKTPDTKEFIFNVDRNNGIPFDRKIKNQETQKRYWYFKKVDAIKGYGKDIDTKINIQPEVTFAGDVYNIGLGELILIEYSINNNKIFKLGIIADTGGAFIPNLYQLDFLSGIYDSRKDFESSTKNLPKFPHAYILIKK